MSPISLPPDLWSERFQGARTRSNFRRDHRESRCSLGLRDPNTRAAANPFGVQQP